MAVPNALPASKLIRTNYPRSLGHDPRTEAGTLRDRGIGTEHAEGEVRGAGSSCPHDRLGLTDAVTEG